MYGSTSCHNIGVREFDLASVLLRYPVTSVNTVGKQVATAPTTHSGTRPICLPPCTWFQRTLAAHPPPACLVTASNQRGPTWSPPAALRAARMASLPLLSHSGKAQHTSAAVWPDCNGTGGKGCQCHERLGGDSSRTGRHGVNGSPSACSVVSMTEPTHVRWWQRCSCMRAAPARPCVRHAWLWCLRLPRPQAPVPKFARAAAQAGVQCSRGPLGPLGAPIRQGWGSAVLAWAHHRPEHLHPAPPQHGPSAAAGHYTSGGAPWSWRWRWPAAAAVA
jgi:hypothetical protein